MRTIERNFTVAPLEGNRWRVTCDAASSTALFVSRRDAIQYAHACAQAYRPSVVRVLSPRGTLEDMWSYGVYKGIRRTDPGALAASSDAQSQQLTQRNSP